MVRKKKRPAGGGPIWNEKPETSSASPSMQGRRRGNVQPPAPSLRARIHRRTGRTGIQLTGAKSVHAFRVENERPHVNPLISSRPIASCTDRSASWMRPGGTAGSGVPETAVLPSVKGQGPYGLSWFLVRTVGQLASPRSIAAAWSASHSSLALALKFKYSFPPTIFHCSGSPEAR